MAIIKNRLHMIEVWLKGQNTNEQPALWGYKLSLDMPPNTYVMRAAETGLFYEFFEDKDQTRRLSVCVTEILYARSTPLDEPVDPSADQDKY